jgi:restriction endonuclease
MARYSKPKIAGLLYACDNAATRTAAGKALEDLASYLLQKLPGVELSDRNILDAPRAHELDLAFWNLPAKSPISFLDSIIIVECKNTGTPVGSDGVGWFVRKLQDHGAHSGILVALSGITGAQDGQSNAHHEVLTALTRDRIKILLLSRQEIVGLNTTDELALLLREKFLALSLRLTVR